MKVDCLNSRFLWFRGDCANKVGGERAPCRVKRDSDCIAIFLVGFASLETPYAFPIDRLEMGYRISMIMIDLKTRDESSVATESLVSNDTL